MKIKIGIFFICILVSCLFAILTIDAVESILARLLIGLLFGVGFGILAFKDATSPIILKAVSYAFGALVFLGFVALYAFSPVAQASIIPIGAVIAIVLSVTALKS